MNYQVGYNNQKNSYSNIFTNGINENEIGMDSEKKGNPFLGNHVGDLLECTLVKAGKNPILDMNGVQIKTKATKELESAKEGDTIFLKIQQADKSQVSLKIVGTKSSEDRSNLNIGQNVQMMQTTEQFSEMIKENLDGALDEKTAKENQKEILRSLSTDEIAKLRRMQIDVTNSTLSDLLGMVITIRSNHHQEERNEQLEDLVKNTMDKLEKSTSVEEGSLIPQNEPMVTDEQLVYMVKNNMGLTIENLEKAKNSVNEESPSQILPLNNKVWNDIYPQVLSIIEAEGRSVTAQNLSGAQFMLQHELPITVDSLRLYMSVNSLNQRGLQKNQVKANIQEQIALGNSPEQARIHGRTIHEKAEQLVEKVEGITESAINKAVVQGKLLTISYLYNTSMRDIDVQGSGRAINTGVEGASLSLSGIGKKEYEGQLGMPADKNLEAVSARRQLEEIRLSMTMEAAIRLVRHDINIDAKPLSKIVDVLRTQENKFYENVVSAHDLHDIPDGVDLLKETLKETDALKTLPEYALGEAVKKPTITLGGLYQTATRMKAVLAGNAYETMMTRPRVDLGDSIRDAFRNINDLLMEMDMESNEENQRAIRILSYNQMELNEKNITSVKVVDAKVQQMFETLTPQIVLNLIRDNKNPINMTIDGLNEEIMNQKEILGVTDEQRFSEFLYQMDRIDGMTEDERKSFIGIYRLLDKIEKSHGKDIGAVVRNGQEVTLNNLFSAVKSRKTQGFDVKIDENFGERVDVETSKATIINQIGTAYNQTLTSSILRHIRPETLKSMERMDYRNMSFEELNTIIKAADQEGEKESDLIKDLSSHLQEAFSYEEEVEMMLEANDMPKTATNILAAHQVMYEQNGIYGIIRNMKGNLSKEKKEKITQAEAKILETLESKSDVIYGLENIRAGISEAIHDKEQEGTITAKDIQALKFLNAGMPIAMRAVEEDVFQIPLVIGEEVSIMKVSILQNAKKAGDIKATMETSNYGLLESYMHVEGNQIEGYVVTEEEIGQKVLEQNELTLRSSFAKIGMEARDLRLDGTKPESYGSEIIREEVSTSKLYKVAKQLLTAIKLTGIVADN